MILKSSHGYVVVNKCLIHYGHDTKLPHGFSQKEIISHFFPSIFTYLIFLNKVDPYCKHLPSTLGDHFMFQENEFCGRKNQNGVLGCCVFLYY